MVDGLNLYCISKINGLISLRKLRLFILSLITIYKTERMVSNSKLRATLVKSVD